MGISLYTFGNHKITFQNKNFIDLATEIAEKLNDLQFTNAEFLKSFALNWHKNDTKSIKKILAKKSWTYRKEDEYYNFAENKTIEFEGPFDLELTFSEHNILLWNPPCRYWVWFETDDTDFRNEWRKYMKQIVNAFGGNRVFYAGDNTHHLDSYIYYEGTFEAMELELLAQFGKPKFTFKEVAESVEDSYFIDDFTQE